MATTRPGKRIPGPPSIPGASGEIAGRGDDYLSRDAVLEHLHIKPQTLYSYVSRGFIRSVPQPDGRSSFYLREDVEPVAAGLARVFGMASGALHLNPINAALAAVADHELNPATFAARRLPGFYNRLRASARVSAAGALHRRSHRRAAQKADHHP